MASLTIDDSCCRVEILESTLNQEAKTYHLVENLLEAALLGYHVSGSHSGEKDEYAKLLNESTTYAHRQFHAEVLAEEFSSKKEEKCTPKVELKPLPSHLKIKQSLISTPIIQTTDWDLPFEIMYDTNDHAVGAVLG